MRFCYYKLGSDGGVHTSDADELLDRLRVAIQKFRIAAPAQPTHLVLGRDDWASYQGMVQAFKFFRVTGRGASRTEFCGLPILQSTEPRGVLAVRQTWT